MYTNMYTNMYIYIYTHIFTVHMCTHKATNFPAMLPAIIENTGAGQPIEVDGRGAAIVPLAKLVGSLCQIFTGRNATVLVVQKEGL